MFALRGELLGVAAAVGSVEADEADAVAHRLVDALEVGHLLLARRAPRRPHVHHERRAAVVGEALGAVAAQSLEGAVGQGRALYVLGDREGGRLADRARLLEDGVGLLAAGAAAGAGDGDRGHRADHEAGHRAHEHPSGVATRPWRATLPALVGRDGGGPRAVAAGRAVAARVAAVAGGTVQAVLTM